MLSTQEMSFVGLDEDNDDDDAADANDDDSDLWTGGTASVSLDSSSSRTASQSQRVHSLYIDVVRTLHYYYNYYYHHHHQNTSINYERLVMMIRARGIHTASIHDYSYF